MSAETRVLLIAAPFYEDITEQLVSGAQGACDAAGVTADVVEVPGALEIPAVIALSELGKAPYDAYVALGCVIRGETSHFDYVCGESARGLMDLTLKGVPVGNGILTVENIKQARVRANVHEKNKGGDAANAALALLSLKKKFGAA
ncbi:MULTISPECIES: 6,7-dimethyl-8-ribityllumazine synthase [Oceanicaulis]|uniref:6,7-dimethyl-8-ribityllumazine synthase n=1 Tax=Oceanicaulis TaxID=153232 RepID=UPI0003B79F31|nr:MULTISPECIES: 6,7-dimethyl-8-ribityllumazine synthase [Oceanicaulis]MBL4537046.1 6,7-dimethyl-8-ribityllumazine synthase [Oceanicaulis sp.]HCR65104.1 6,7-dimethyl-8-ribityllumazine synthase [Oceanicaulis sp.]